MRVCRALGSCTLNSFGEKLFTAPLLHLLCSWPFALFPEYHNMPVYWLLAFCPSQLQGLLAAGVALTRRNAGKAQPDRHFQCLHHLSSDMMAPDWTGMTDEPLGKEKCCLFCSVIWISPCKTAAPGLVPTLRIQSTLLSRVS